jgi:DeoR family glycerol-3-phosphate regulon repressor
LAKRYLLDSCETAIEYVRQFQMDLCFLSCSGIDEKGLYEASSQESYVKQEMMCHSNSTVVLCDQSKFNRGYKFRPTPCSSVHALITDAQPPANIAETAANSKCQIIY